MQPWDMSADRDKNRRLERAKVQLATACRRIEGILTELGGSLTVDPDRALLPELLGLFWQPRDIGSNKAAQLKVIHMALETLQKEKRVAYDDETRTLGALFELQPKKGKKQRYPVRSRQFYNRRAA